MKFGECNKRRLADRLSATAGVMCDRVMRVVLLFTTILVGCVESTIDACLDEGGSFDYEKCECDFEVNHEYKESHQCE